MKNSEKEKKRGRLFDWIKADLANIQPKNLQIVQKMRFWQKKFQDLSEKLYRSLYLSYFSRVKGGMKYKTLKTFSLTSNSLLET